MKGDFHLNEEYADEWRERAGKIVRWAYCSLVNRADVWGRYLKPRYRTNKHGIEVDEVCRHKPPAHIYVDDRAIRFGGDWDETIIAINEFRK